MIHTFTAIIKRQFTDRETLLVNTAHALKFLEDYADRQAQIWQVLQKHHDHSIPDLIDDSSTDPDTTTYHQDPIQTDWPDTPTIQICIFNYYMYLQLLQIPHLKWHIIEEQWYTLQTEKKYPK